MDRRRVLLGSALALSLPLTGCTHDDLAPSERDEDPPGDAVPGRIEPLGHTLPQESPFYTFGHVSPGGEWAVLGSFPTSESAVASTLVDLADLERPETVHELDTSDPGARTNDVKFDALREGLYYRTQEGVPRVSRWSTSGGTSAPRPIRSSSPRFGT